MSRLRPFQATDLFTFNRINLDHFTETYSLGYYLQYLATWPELCFIATSASASPSEDTVSTPEVTDGICGGLEGTGLISLPQANQPMGYLIGKAEGKDTPKTRERHGHVTAVTVAPEFRRLGLAGKMMELLELASSAMYDAYFIDLFVRPSNALAVGLYTGLEYSIYRRVKEYYAGGGPDGADEDGYDMRKALPRDSKRETVRDSQKGMNTVVDVHSTMFEPAHRI